MNKEHLATDNINHSFAGISTKIELTKRTFSTYSHFWIPENKCDCERNAK